jgi:hypothetical protein
MSSREIISKAARRLGWDTVQDARAQMAFRRIDVEVIVQFRRNGGVLIAEFWDLDTDGMDQISGGCPAVVDTLTTFGRT